MSVEMNLPVDEILKELANSKNPEIIDFCDWLKEQKEDSVLGEPLINCINWRSPDLVFLNWYATEHLEDEGLNPDKWRDYRINGGDTVNPYSLTEDLMNEVNDVLGEDSYSDDDYYEDYDDEDEV